MERNFMYSVCILTLVVLIILKETCHCQWSQALAKNELNEGHLHHKLTTETDWRNNPSGYVMWF
jgi:hypothetical protein